MDILISFLFVYFLIVYTIYHFSTAPFCLTWDKTNVVIGEKEHLIYYFVADERFDDFSEIANRRTTYYLQDEATFNTQFFIVSSFIRTKNESGFSEIKRCYYPVNLTKGCFGSKIKQLALSEDKTKRQETFDQIIEQIEKHRFGHKKCPYKIG